LKRRYDQGYMRENNSSWALSSKTLYPDLEIRRRVLEFRNFILENESVL
jgi:hypothetical protein